MILGTKNGDKSLSDPRIGVTRFAMLNNNPLEGHMLVGSRQTDAETSHRKTRDILARTIVKHVEKLSACSQRANTTFITRPTTFHLHLKLRITCDPQCPPHPGPCAFKPHQIFTRTTVRRQSEMAVLQRATGKPAGSVFIFNFAVANFTMVNELELMAVHTIWELVVNSVSWKEFQKIDGECGQDTHSQCTSVQCSLFTSAERTTRLAQVITDCIASLCA